VKVRGYRIEPGEIEAVLEGHPAVRECAVVAHAYGVGDKRLVAYAVAEPFAEAIPLTVMCEVEFSEGQRETRLTETVTLGQECQLTLAGPGAAGLTLRLRIPEIANDYWLTGEVIGQETGRTRLRLRLTPDERALLQKTLARLPALNALLLRNVREYLKRKLPGYMLPSTIVFMEALPRTSSGKVDRQALRAPASLSTEGTPAYVSPRTPLEEKVAGIWAEVLHLERVGAEDNFFDVGGHSLLATQVISRVRETFGVEVSLLEMFAEPTVAGLAAAIDQAQSSGQASPPAPAIVPVARQRQRVRLSSRGELLREGGGREKLD
jgi:acyl carrier protein